MAKNNQQNKQEKRAAKAEKKEARQAERQTQRAKEILPGILKRDYNLVQYGGRYYVVYDVEFGGRRLKLSWRVDKEFAETAGLDLKKATRITRADFDNLNFFGNADEIVQRGEEQHPFKTFLNNLRDEFPNASFLEDDEVLSEFLAGYAEGLTEDQIFNRLANTKWFKNKTQYQRQWELDLTPKEKKVALEKYAQEVQDMFVDLFGSVNWRDHIDDETFKDYVFKVASGFWGEPSDGFNFLEGKIEKMAQRIEGTAAFNDFQLGLEKERQIANRPEEAFEQLRTDAMRWLGPKGMPSNALLWEWSKAIVAQTRSQADFDQFLRRQAKALYPWLGADEPWQDRADSYKAEAERQWDQPIGYDHPLLAELGVLDKDGNPTGAAMSFGQWRKKLRSHPTFWGTKTARDEGYSILAQLNETFTGVQ